MARIRTIDQGQTWRLATTTWLGRDADCALRFREPWISSKHATLSWSGVGWLLRDRGSRNGTWLDGKRVGALEVAIRRGQRIGLGQPEPLLELYDDGPPTAFARRLEDGLEVDETSGVLDLPSPQGPRQLSMDLELNAWVMAEGEQDRTLRDRDRVVLDGTWELFLPAPVTDTIDLGAGWTVDDVRVGFRISRDFEHVAVALVPPDGSAIWLEPRVHFWPLYLLARARLDDGEAPEHDQGWMNIEALARASGLERRTLDIYVVRARRALAEQRLLGAEAIVEVRRGQRRIGLPPQRLWVERV